MKVVVPIAIGVANYPSSGGAPYGYVNAYGSAEYSAVTAYVVGNRVIVDALQSEFECVVNNTGTTPTIAMTTPWIRVGASNAWKPFDGIVSSPSIGYSSGFQQQDLMVYTIWALGPFSTVCVLSTDCSWVQVTFVAPDGTSTVSATRYATDFSPIIDAWTNCFADFNIARDFIFDDIDGWGTTTTAGILVAVSYQFTGLAVQVGEIIVGNAVDIGDCHAGAKLSLNDFSRKEQNAFGDLEIVERAYSFTGTFDIEIDVLERNRVQSLIAALRATPCVWYPTSEDANDGLVIYGFEKTFEITYETPTKSFASLEVEGLT